MKKLIPFLLSAALLQANPILESERVARNGESPSLEEGVLQKFPQELPLSTLPPEKKEVNFFSYFSLGALGWMNHFPIAPDLSLGRRKLDSHHVWDMNLGANPFVIYGQASYLYFPNPSSGFYFGVGVTGGHGYSLLPLKGFHINLPLTIGNQFAKEKGYNFLQLQITPLLTTTLSYGIGF